MAAPFMLFCGDTGPNMRRRQFIILLGVGIMWAALAQAQQPSAPTIGFMSGRSPDEAKHLVAAFHQGLSESGFVEGKNVAIEYRWALGQYDRLPALAADLVNQRVAVLVAVGGDLSALAAKQATSTIPIVFGLGGDPVKAGIVESLNRPGANATGYTLLTADLEPKRLGMLHDLVPNASLIGVLVNPKFPPAASQITTLEKAAQTIAQRLVVSRASNDTELDASLASLLQQRIDALLVMSDPYFDTRRGRIIAFAAQNKLSAIYQFREYAADGGLISYGPNITESYRHAGTYVGQILKGAKPADLPVFQPTKYEFVINLKTAKSLGLAIPAGLISFADEVIE